MLRPSREGPKYFVSSKFTSGYRKLSQINDFLIPSTGAQARRTCRRGAPERERERARERKEREKAKGRRERARRNENSEGNEKKHEIQGALKKLAETLERVGGGAQARVAETMERQPDQERLPVHYF